MFTVFLIRSSLFGHLYLVILTSLVERVFHFTSFHFLSFKFLCFNFFLFLEVLRKWSWYHDVFWLPSTPHWLQSQFFHFSLNSQERERERERERIKWAHQCFCLTWTNLCVLLSQFNSDPQKMWCDFYTKRS